MGKLLDDIDAQLAEIEHIMQRDMNSYWRQGLDKKYRELHEERAQLAAADITGLNNQPHRESEVRANAAADEARADSLRESFGGEDMDKPAPNQRRRMALGQEPEKPERDGPLYDPGDFESVRCDRDEDRAMLDSFFRGREAHGSGAGAGWRHHGLV